MKENKAIILTALPVEYQAVRLHLSDIQEVEYKGTIYEEGNFQGETKIWRVLIAEVGAGNMNAAFEAERAISFFEPTLAFFIGVAGGVKDADIGDVVVATKVYGYESGKVEDTFKSRPDVGESSYSLIQRAKAESKKTNWLKRINTETQTSPPSVYVGAIAAGEKLVVSTKSDIFNFLKSTYNDTLAVEMEGRGFLKALHASNLIPPLVIRGISDLIDNKNDDLDSNRQQIASAHASAFGFEVLSKL